MMVTSIRTQLANNAMVIFFCISFFFSCGKQNHKTNDTDVEPSWDEFVICLKQGDTLKLRKIASNEGFSSLLGYSDSLEQLKKLGVYLHQCRKVIEKDSNGFIRVVVDNEADDGGTGFVFQKDSIDKYRYKFVKFLPAK